jgi:hypothetical protein
MMRRLSIKPIRAFFLDVPPETSISRKVDDFDLPQLTRRAALYRSEWRTFGAIRFDALRPREELCAEIAAEVWKALGSR